MEAEHRSGIMKRPKSCTRGTESIRTRCSKKLAEIKISVHCWQGDDVRGFLNPGQALTGGISVTGNYPGAARRRTNFAPIWRKRSRSFRANIR